MGPYCCLKCVSTRLDIGWAVHVNTFWLHSFPATTVTSTLVHTALLQCFHFLSASAPLSRRVIMDTHSIRSLLPFHSLSSIYSCAFSHPRHSLRCFLSIFMSGALLQSTTLQSGPCPRKLDERLKELSSFSCCCYKISYSL